MDSSEKRVERQLIFARFVARTSFFLSAFLRNRPGPRTALADFSCYDPHGAKACCKASMAYSQSSDGLDGFPSSHRIHEPREPAHNEVNAHDGSNGPR